MTSHHGGWSSGPSLIDEIPEHNSLGAKSFWLVEAMVAAGFLNQARRDAALGNQS
jgi:hypothetical protein